MKTILRILKQAGGWHHGLYLKIENPPYMALVIEATDESGPCGLPAISVCHYGKQNGDAMRDPEARFSAPQPRHTKWTPMPLLKVKQEFAAKKKAKMEKKPQAVAKPAQKRVT